MKTYGAGGVLRQDAKYPVSWSDEPLVFDVVNAVRLPFHQGGGRHIYSYFKLYVLGGRLAVGGYVFERTPAPGSVLCLAAGAPGAAEALYVALYPGEARLFTAAARELLALRWPAGAALESEGFSGNDEQGYYWGRSVLVPEEKLAAVGLRLSPGTVFHLGAVQRNEGEGGFSASFPPEAPVMEEAFEVVDY